MKILYDHQMFTMQKFGGVTRYFAELMACLPNGFEACLPSGLWSDNYYLSDTVGYPSRVLDRPKNFRLRRRVYYFMNTKRTIRHTRCGEYDLLHPTWYDPYVLRGHRKPLVITVHDLIQERFHKDFLVYDRSAKNKQRMMNEADHIIAVSEHTKADIVTLAGINPEKISVVHHGYRKTVEPAPPMADHYVLYVGDRRKYKNFTTFIEGMVPLLKEDERLSVICAGSPFTEAEYDFLKRLGIREYQLKALQVTDAQLMSLYKYADVFVYPSLYEGFGIPILEAFANDCPVCLSKASCFPEVAGEAAIYFDPHSPQAIGDSVQQILKNKATANHLRELGKKRVTLFTIDKMVDETCRVYRKFQSQ